MRKPFYHLTLHALLVLFFIIFYVVDLYVPLEIYHMHMHVTYLKT